MWVSIKFHDQSIILRNLKQIYLDTFRGLINVVSITFFILNLEKNMIYFFLISFVVLNTCCLNELDLLFKILQNSWRRFFFFCCTKVLAHEMVILVILIVNIYQIQTMDQVLTNSSHFTVDILQLFLFILQFKGSYPFLGKSRNPSVGIYSKIFRPGILCVICHE